MRIVNTIITAAVIVAVLATTTMAAVPKPIKVYIVAGQSNAVARMGVEFLADSFPEYAKPRQDIWRMRPGIKSPAYFMGPKYRVFGIEHAAGYILADAVDNDILFIRSAVGGTMLYDRWRSPSAVKRLGGPVGDLYDAMIRRVHNMLANLEQFHPNYKGQGYELAGMLWFQGENDCCANTQGFYRDSLMDLIADTRSELGVPNLPVAIVKINDGCWGPPAVDVWAAEEYAAHADKNVVVVVSRDLRRLCHYDAQSYITIGQRLGKALLPFARKPVHVGDAKVRTAAKAFFARTTSPGTPQDMASLMQGLVGYWKFDEGKGTRTESAIDAGGMGITFSRPGGAGEWIKGKFGKAVKLTGMQSITFPEFTEPVNEAGRIEQMSIAFWARTTGGKGEYRIGRGQGQKVVGRLGPDNWYLSENANRQGWDVRGFDGGNASITATVVGVDGKPATFGSLAKEGFGADGIRWRHQAFVYDAKAKTVRFYTDGKLVQTHKTTVPVQRKKRPPVGPGVPAGEIVPLTSNRRPMMIGGIELGDMDFDYSIYDELAIWSRPITDAEVAKLYNGGAGAEIIASEPMATKTVGELRKVLKTDVDGLHRYRAVVVLADRTDAAAEALLVETLRDRSYGIKYAAARALGEKGRDTQARALKMLVGDDQDFRVLATVMFKHMGRKADPVVVVPALVKALKDDFFDVRINATKALGGLGDWAADAVPALLAATHDNEWWVRDEAHKALTAIRTPAARAGMIEALDRDRHSVTWFQTASVLMAPLKADPALQQRLALSYASWLCKGEGWTAPFAARGKFGCGLRGLQEMVKAKQPIPASVGKTIERILAGKEEPLWKLDDRNNRKSLEDVLTAIKAQTKEGK